MTTTTMREMRRFIRYTLLLLGFVVLDAYAADTPLPAASPPAVAAAATQWKADEFPLGFWVGPPPALNTLEAYRMMKDCGLTFATTSIGYTKADNLKMLDHCQTVGLKALVGFHEQMIPAWPKGDGWDAIAEAGVQDYASHAALGGWGLFDEPRADAFPGLAKMNRTLGERTPGKLRFINVLPNYATPAQLGTRNYQEYLDTFLTTVKPDVLCYDHYPEVKKLNHQMHTLGNTLLTLTSTGVYHAGKMPRGGLPVPVDAALQLPTDQPLMIGFFRQDGSTDEFAIVVNRDYTKRVECDLRLRSAVHEVQLISAADGAPSPLPGTGGKLPLALAPGEGKLLKLSAKPGNLSPLK